MYKTIILISIVYISFCAAESDPKQIRQCTCDEVQNCWEETREKFEPCKSSCMQKLNAPGLDHDAAMKCFEENRPQRMECHKQLREKMCTLDENKMIDVNETWQGRGHGHGHGHGHKKNHNHHNSSDSNSIEEHGIGHGHGHGHGHEHGHFRQGFFMFIKKTFGKSGREFTKCMHHCFRHKRQNINCAKKNNCGVRRMPREEFREHMQQCMKTDEKKPRLQLCECLKEAGLQKIECDQNILDKNFKLWKAALPAFQACMYSLTY